MEKNDRMPKGILQQRKESVISGTDEISKTLHEIIKLGGKSEGERQAPVNLKDVGISVEVTKNIDVIGRDDNIKVMLRLKTDNGYEDSRELSVNGACEDAEYIRQALLNMGFLDEKGVVSNAIKEIVKGKIGNMEFDLQHEKIGWSTYKGNTVFQLFNIHSISGEKKSEYIGNLQIAKKGNRAGYTEGLKQLVVGKPKLEIALVVGVYGVLLQALKLPDCNLIINFFGVRTGNTIKNNTGIGKSTAAKLCLMLYGNAHDLFRTHNDTDNKSEAGLAERTVIPYVFDDKLVSYIGTSQRRQISDLVKFVFRFTTGKVRGRLNDDKCKSFEEIYAPTIITAESSIAEKMIGVYENGQFSRIIEISCRKGELTDSKEHCEQLEEFISSHAGVGGEAFVEFLFRENLLDEALKEKYKYWIKKLNAGVLGKTHIGSRVADKVGIIMLSAELLNQCFGLDMDIDTIQETLEKSVQGVNESTNFDNRAYEHLCSYVKKNEHRFVEDRTQYVLKTKNETRDETDVNSHIGHYKCLDNQWQVWLLSESIHEIFKNFPGFENAENLVRPWKYSGLLMSAYEKETRFTVRKTYCSGVKQGHMYIIKMPDLKNQ